MSTVKSTPRIARGSNISPAWMHDPARVCLKADEELFYHPEGERGPERIERAEKAKAVCRTCPFMDACRLYARDTREPYGTWGGESEAERAKFLQGLPAKPRRIKVAKVTPDPVEPAPAPEPVRLEIVPVSPMAGMNPGDMVAADPVIAHVLRLQADGLTQQQIATAAGMSRAAVANLAHGRPQTVRWRTYTTICSIRVAPSAAAA